MIISRPWECTKLDIWQPKYNTDSGDWEVWLSTYKIRYASPVIIIQFTKAKHLLGQRFCVRRSVVERCERGSNGKIPVYKVPFDKLEGWDSAAEVRDLALNLFED